MDDAPTPSSGPPGPSPSPHIDPDTKSDPRQDAHGPGHGLGFGSGSGWRGFTGEGSGPRVTGAEMLDLGRLRRSVDSRYVAGVAGGLARHLDVDPIIVRVALAVLTIFGGAGLIVYAAIWVLVPDEGSADQPLGLDERNRRLALMGAGVLAVLAALGDWSGAFWLPWPVLALVLVGGWFLFRQRSTSSRSGYGVPGYGPSPQMPYPPQQAPAHGQPPTPGAGPGPEAGPAYQHPATGWGVPGPAAGPEWGATAYSRPRNPRRRGPVLVWWTLVLIALGLATLGIVDAAGTAVPAPAYPALALTISGVMLLLGAFWGRAGGIILIGLMAAVATLGATLGSQWNPQRVTHAPAAASQVRDAYSFDAGDNLYDFSAVEDVEALDGRDISIDGGFGAVEVVVPDGMDVTVNAGTGVGEVRLLDQRASGPGAHLSALVDGGDDVPDLSISVDLGVGEVTVRDR